MGDYIDRGMDSAGAIARLAGRIDAPETVCLKGNHEELLETFLIDPVEGAANFLSNGGVETLASYGVAAHPEAFGEVAIAIRDAFLAVLPETHRRFLAELRYSASFGDYFFCHAGVRPGIPLDRQDPHDLVWIRGTFHRDRGDHGKVVIHAHTPVAEPDVQPNRINIDTGAWYSGRLTCLALEGSGYRFV
jgi:serine/threonine protein phosphatase 1